MWQWPVIGLKNRSRKTVLVPNTDHDMSGRTKRTCIFPRNVLKTLRLSHNSQQILVRVSFYCKSNALKSGLLPRNKGYSFLNIYQLRHCSVACFHARKYIMVQSTAHASSEWTDGNVRPTAVYPYLSSPPTITVTSTRGTCRHDVCATRMRWTIMHVHMFPSTWVVIQHIRNKCTIIVEYAGRKV